jgi:hypothetical protein
MKVSVQVSTQGVVPILKGGDIFSPALLNFNPAYGAPIIKVAFKFSLLVFNYLQG